jgi:DNA-binding FadR family transcriptional regulator
LNLVAENTVALAERNAGQVSAGVQLADRIAQDVLDGKSAPGTVIASEHELRVLHDAGRSVLRQAVRILEERGVAHMRRGFGGGLVVAAPNADFAARGLSIVLESVMQETQDLQQLSLLPSAVDTHLFVHGAPRLSLEKCEALLRLVRRLDRLPDDEFLRVGAHRQLHLAIRTVSGEPAVTLAHKTAIEHGIDLIPYSVSVASESAKDEPWRINCETAAALVAGDVGRLFDCNRRLTEIVRASWGDWQAIDRDPGQAPKINDLKRPEFQLPSSRAERLAREILREIRLAGWSPGARIGGGAELMKRYGASSGILRQAVRMLQEHSAVRVDKGRNGGLFIAVLDRQQAVSRAIAFLRQSAAAPSDVKAFLVHLTLEALDQGPAIPAEALHGELGQGRAVSFVDLCQIVSGAIKSPVLQIFMDILLPLIAAEGAPGAAGRVVPEVFAARDPVQRRRAFLLAAQTQSGAAPVV